jgi:BirA family biotin operon repressor/biotin-[acetyl-CoA-carboxylase] ligase
MKLLLGKTVDLEKLLKSFQIELMQVFLKFEEVGADIMQKEYEKVLFRKDKPSTFKDTEGTMFMGFIRGITDDGRLKVSLEDEVLKKFNMKEIELLY